ncbi:hypothetical protein RCG24_17120 [Neobacillus sp. OS1-32]|nr:hypothetical protein [Neobacillus sp. OS1-32]WML29621.1 hypothetical protein RCG24_17120 [Neobacillus sp. OS1-32]
MIDLYETNPEGVEEKKRIIEYADRKLHEINEQISELQILRDEILSYKERYLHSKELE